MVEITDIDKGMERALQILRAGNLVAVPTETVYGLGADATNDAAVTKIYQAKGRPSFNPLISHVGSFEMAERYGIFEELARKLAQQFWPGPLTLVLPLIGATDIAASVVAGLDTIALRQPHGFMARLSNELDRPIAAPSANTSGKLSPTTAQHVADDLDDKVDLIVDGGPCQIGVESTIIKVMDGSVFLLREGGVTRQQLEQFCKKPLQDARENTKIEAPGQLLAHYAPALPLRINANQARETEAVLAFGPQEKSPAPITLNLSPTADLAEAARNLFAMLKQLDHSGARSIAVQPIPITGIGAAINDRLKRAAHQEKS